MKRFINILLAVATLLATLIMPLQASAASNSIGINPRKDYTINPGDSKSDTLMVKDLDNKNPLDLSIQVLDFQAAGQSGTPKLLLSETRPSRWSLKPYLTIQSSATVPAGQTQNIPFTISIPKNLGAGSYYSAVRFSTGSGNDSSSVGLTSSAVSLIFVRVTGKANDSLIMKNFGAFVPVSDFSGGAYKTFFGAAKPQYLSYTLQNTGNVAEEPIGSIQIKNMFGKQYELIQNINPNHNLVLLNQTRRIDVCISEPNGTNDSNTDNSVENISKCPSPSMWPGRYTAKIDLLYGNNGSSTTEIRGTSSFWYLPAWFIIGVLVVLAIIVGGIWLIVRTIQNRKERVYRRR